MTMTIANFDAQNGVYLIKAVSKNLVYLSFKVHKY